MREQHRAEDFPYFDNGGLPIAFAHRGGSTTADLSLENTMQAFQTAVDLGFRYIETDVHATADGVLVVNHDATLQRTAGHPGVIARLAHADLSDVRVAGTQRIPTLDELLSTFPDVRFNIDAKSPESVPLLAKAVHERKAWDRVCLASFSARSLRQLRRLLTPRVATSYSAPGAAAMLFLPGRRLRARLLGYAAVAQVPVRNRGVPVATPRFIDRAHELGKQVHVWTVDDAAEIHRLLDLGVDGIFSDRIDVLREVFTARGIWQG